MSTSVSGNTVSAVPLLSSPEIHNHDAQHEMGITDSTVSHTSDSSKHAIESGEFMKAKVKRRATHNTAAAAPSVTTASSSHLTSSIVKSSKALKTESAIVTTSSTVDSTRTNKPGSTFPRTKRRVTSNKSNGNKNSKLPARDELSTLLSLPTTGSPSHNIPTDDNTPSHFTNGHSPLSADPYEFQDLKFEVPTKKSKLETVDKMELSSHSAKENKSSIMKRGNSHADEPVPPPPPPSYHDKETNTVTSETMTEGEFFGPCPPGTQANLNAIVWLETTGLLVVNISWRGRTYVGTLLDCTKHNYAPTNLYTYQPPYETRVSYRGRGKRRNVNYNVNGRTTRGTKGKTGPTTATIPFMTTSNSKTNRSTPAYPTNSSPMNSAAEESGDDEVLNGCAVRRGGGRSSMPTDSPDGSVCGSNGTESLLTCSTTTMPNPSNCASAAEQSDGDDKALYVCPWPECHYRFSKLTALRYHQTHKHSPPVLTDAITPGTQPSISTEDTCEPTPPPSFQTLISTDPVSTPTSKKSLTGKGKHLTGVPCQMTTAVFNEDKKHVKLFSSAEPSVSQSTSQSPTAGPNQVQVTIASDTIASETSSSTSTSLSINTNVPFTSSNAVKPAGGSSTSSPPTISHCFLNGIKLSSHNGGHLSTSTQSPNRIVSAQTVSIPMESNIIPPPSSRYAATSLTTTSSKFCTSLANSTVSIVPGTNLCPPLHAPIIAGSSPTDVISSNTTHPKSLLMPLNSSASTHSYSLTTPTKKRKRSPSRQSSTHTDNTPPSSIVRTHAVTDSVLKSTSLPDSTAVVKELSISPTLNDFPNKVVVNSFPTMCVSLTPDTSSCNAPPSPAYSDISDSAPVLEKEEDFKSPGTCSDKNGGVLPYPPPSLVPAISTACVDLSHRNRETNSDSQNALASGFVTNSNGKSMTDNQEIRAPNTLNFVTLSNHMSSIGGSKNQATSISSSRDVSDDLEGRMSLLNSIISGAATSSLLPNVLPSIQQASPLVSTLSNSLFLSNSGLQSSAPASNSSSAVKLSASMSTTTQSHISSSSNPFAQFSGATTTSLPVHSSIQPPPATVTSVPGGGSTSNSSALTQQKLLELLTQHMASLAPSTSTNPTSLHQLSTSGGNTNPLNSMNMMNPSSPAFTLYPPNGLLPQTSSSLPGGFMFSSAANTNATNAALVNAMQQQQQRAMFQQHK